MLNGLAISERQTDAKQSFELAPGCLMHWLCALLCTAMEQIDAWQSVRETWQKLHLLTW